jgi:hypothetical protein
VTTDLEILSQIKHKLDQTIEELEIHRLCSFSALHRDNWNMGNKEDIMEIARVLDIDDKFKNTISILKEILSGIDKEIHVF